MHETGIDDVCEIHVKLLVSCFFINGGSINYSTSLINFIVPTVYIYSEWVITSCHLSFSCQWSYNPLRFPRFPGDGNGSKCKFAQSQCLHCSLSHLHFDLKNRNRNLSRLIYRTTLMRCLSTVDVLVRDASWQIPLRLTSLSGCLRWRRW